MRKVYVIVTSRLIISMDEGVEIDDVISEMDYNFTSNNDKTYIVDAEIRDYEVIDPK